MVQNLNRWGIKKSEIDPCYKNIAEKYLLNNKDFFTSIEKFEEAFNKINNK